MLTGPDWSSWQSVLLVVLPVGSCSLLTSQYLTVSISVERYCGICYPLQSRVRGGRRLVIYLLPVILFREERIETISISTYCGSSHRINFIISILPSPR